MSWTFEMAERLSAAGWTFVPETLCWRKGAHAMSREALIDFAGRWPGLIDETLKAIERGAVGFKAKYEILDNDAGVSFTLEWEWPDPVTRLGKLACLEGAGR